MPLNQHVSFPAVLEKCGKSTNSKNNRMAVQNGIQTKPFKSLYSGRGGHEHFCAKNGQRRAHIRSKKILFTVFGKVDNLRGTLWK